MLFEILHLSLFVIAAVSGRDTRIIGGIDADSYTFPYHASLRHATDKHVICGGAIISNRHIITTAHCVDPRYVDHNSLMILTGFAKRIMISAYQYFPENIVIHPEYVQNPDSSTRNLNDIAVIKVLQLILFSNHQSPVSLPEEDVVYRGIGLVSGWGSMNKTTFTPSNSLRSTWVVMIDYLHCLGKVNFDLYADEFCTFQREGVGVGLGDGGCPLVTENKLIGLVYSARPYATGHPEIYINVYRHIEFITLAMLDA